MSQGWQQFIDSLNPGSQDTTGMTGAEIGNTGATPTGSPYPGSNMVDNGNGTWTDTSTGIMYDATGTSLGNDPSLTDAMNGGTSGGIGSIPGLSGLSGLGGLTPLLSALIPGLLGAYSASQTGKATGQVLQGIQNAQTSVSGLLGGQSAFAPYVGAGGQALNNLQGMGWQPINMGPLGGRPVTLGTIAAAPATTKGK
jgi:hypothetical protein